MILLENMVENFSDTILTDVPFMFLEKNVDANIGSTYSYLSMRESRYPANLRFHLYFNISSSLRNSISVLTAFNQSLPRFLTPVNRLKVFSFVKSNPPLPTAFIAFSSCKHAAMI